MQRRFADIVRYVTICNKYIITKTLNGFLMTQRQMTLKGECGYNYNVRKLNRPRTSDAS